MAEKSPGTPTKVLRSGRRVAATPVNKETSKKASRIPLIEELDTDTSLTEHQVFLEQVLAFRPSQYQRFTKLLSYKEVSSRVSKTQRHQDAQSHQNSPVVSLVVLSLMKGVAQHLILATLQPVLQRVQQPWCQAWHQMLVLYA